MEEYLVSLDIGTTHAKAMLYSSAGVRICQVSEGYRTDFSDNGFAEQDVEEVSAATEECLRRICSADPKKTPFIRAIVLCSVFHSFICLDKAGKPASRLITWADMRSIRQSERLAEIADASGLRDRTGCSLHPMYFPSKILWMKEELPEVYEKTRMFVSIKEYLLIRWGSEPAVDYSVASGTGLLNEAKLDWDSELLGILGIEPGMLSKLVDTDEIINMPESGPLQKMGFPSGVKVIIGAADGALAHYGTAGKAQCNISLTAGTGAAIRRTSKSPANTGKGHTWCYYMSDGLWLHGVLVQDAGATYNWLVSEIMKPERDEAITNGADPFAAVDELISTIPAGSNGLCFLPFLGGERSPNLNPRLKGAIFGLGFNTKRADIARALIEGICFRLLTAYRCLAEESESTEIFLSGGFLSSPEWVSTTVDFFGRKMQVPSNPDGSGWGGAILGMKRLGWIGDADHERWISETRELLPRPTNKKEYKTLIDRYAELYEALVSSYKA